MNTQQDTSGLDWYRGLFEVSNTVTAHHELYNQLKEVRPDVAQVLIKFNFYRANFQAFGMPVLTDDKGCLGYKLKVRPPKLLHLTLKKKWFDMIASGEKKEEYREIKAHWISRLYDFSRHPVERTHELKGIVEDIVFDINQGHDVQEVLKAYWADQKGIDHVVARNGYASDAPQLKWNHKGLRIGKPNPEWCEPSDKDKLVFILDIGAFHD